MSFGSVTNDYKQHIWGAAAYSNQQAATIGAQEKTADFKNALEELEAEDEAKEGTLKTFGFGATNSDGGRGNGITAMVGASSDMLSQLQFSLLKNNSAALGNSTSSRMTTPLGF